MGVLLAFGFSLTIAVAISVALAKSKNDGRSFSVPIFVVAVIVLNMIAAPIARKWQADWQLQHTPVYQQIAKSDPATFQSIRQAVLDGVENRRTESETNRRIAAIVGRTVRGRIPQASDDSVVAFAKTMSQFLAHMSYTDPDACFYLLHPEQNETDTDNALNDPEVERAEEQLVTAMAQMLESAANRPQAPPDPQQSQSIIQAMFAQLRLKYGKDTVLLSGAGVTAEKRKKVCEISADLFQQVTAMPKIDGSMALRYLVSKTEAQHSVPK